MAWRKLVAGAVIGALFGALLCWTGMASPEVIRKALLFQDSYLFLMFAAAVLTSLVGLRLVRGRRALLTGDRIDWKIERPERRHVVGSLVFGIGWGVADACPGPIATQLGQGILGSGFTPGGGLLGGRLSLPRQEETEPAAEPPPMAEPAVTR